MANDWLSNNDKTQLGCCVQCIPESSQPALYHVANNDKTWMGCCVQCIPELGQPVMFHVPNNDKTCQAGVFKL